VPLSRQLPTPSERAFASLAACLRQRPAVDIWRQFKQRFQIPQITEFYAATEGNVTLFNFDGTEGSVGRIPWWLAHRFPIKVVRFDAERQQPLRNTAGFCIECKADEPGEVIGKIVRDASRPGARFEGYASAADTSRKLLRDVFKKGDTWFRSGDLMRKDKRGHFYFIDRIGDTFRWKGENVSTTEVELALARFEGILEANVYGVQIEGHDGRAGMAAVVAKDNLNLTLLRDHLAGALPEYARPLFLRILGEMDVTATFKQKKIDIVKEGFDPSCVADPVYFSDPQKKAFVRLDAALYHDISAGRIRL
jgi:fatty-acyl-CoA synthase